MKLRKDTPEYIVKSKEVDVAAQNLWHRVVNLVERYEGRTPNPQETLSYVNEIVERQSK